MCKLRDCNSLNGDPSLEFCFIQKLLDRCFQKSGITSHENTSFPFPQEIAESSRQKFQSVLQAANGTTIQDYFSFLFSKVSPSSYKNKFYRIVTTRSSTSRKISMIKLCLYKIRFENMTAFWSKILLNIFWQFPVDLFCDCEEAKNILKNSK